MQLNQVKALVTGGVSGLGLGVARHIIANGGKAVLLDINDEAGAAAEEELDAPMSLPKKVSSHPLMLRLKPTVD